MFSIKQQLLLPSCHRCCYGAFVCLPTWDGYFTTVFLLPGLLRRLLVNRLNLIALACNRHFFFYQPYTWLIVQGLQNNRGSQGTDLTVRQKENAEPQRSSSWHPVWQTRKVGNWTRQEKRPHQRVLNMHIAQLFGMVSIVTSLSPLNVFSGVHVTCLVCMNSKWENYYFREIYLFLWPSFSFFLSSH